VHPGYGFLSENADFAQAVIDAGLTWVGPPPSAIRALGSKSAAKALALRHGVPVLPGYFGADQSRATFIAEAARIGFPLMVKAVAGGGGRGMRLVTDAAQLPAALASARVRSAGGLWQRRPADRTRRAAPAPRGGAGVRRRARPLHPPGRARLLGAAPPPEDHRRSAEPGGGFRAARTARRRAVALAQAAGYVGAGTVEFLLEDTGRGFDRLALETGSDRNK
jgi:geranyl-CoA carboxylase alpha subunit